MLSKAIFIDRDGCVNANDKVGNGPKYVSAWTDFRFLPGALEGLRLLAQTDYHLIVVSNQSCVGRGLVDAVQIEMIFDEMESNICHETGISSNRIDYIFCPHIPEENCACRKPKPGMIYKAAVEAEIDLSRSHMIGDGVSDMEAAILAGIPDKQCIMIETENTSDSLIIPGDSLKNYRFNILCRRADNLLEAAKLIIEADKFKGCV